ncbi:unnamed protein product [Rotaria sp. Silwood2]|nr:unnamed protein product [Rotaria sp. Silwood2]CAF4272758.1 unnamed protein product [Rotaria sp. Silwood2]CAF4430933.1 unnamed protein product [Rotaria sp. Silwood2]
MHGNDLDVQLAKISPVGWNWQPIEQASPMHRQLWESSEWENFKAVVEKIKNVHNILVNIDDTDRDTYRRQQANLSDSLYTTELAILAYREALLSWYGILRKAASEPVNHARLLMVLYVVKAYNQTSAEWQANGIFRLAQPHTRPIGICCLHLARLTSAEWVQIIQNLISNSKYNSAATLLQTLDHKIIQDIANQGNSVTRFFSEQINKTEISMLKRLEPVLSLTNINDILVIAAFVHLENRNDVWSILKEQYLSKPQQYDKVLICHKIQVELGLSVSTDWIDQGIFENNSIAFDLKGLTQYKWMELGRNYLEMANYNTALNCYIKAVRDSSDSSATVFEHILSLISNLSDSVALWYTVVIYKMAQGISSVVCDCINYICKVLDARHQSVQQFIISTLYHFCQKEQCLPLPLVHLHVRAINGLLISSKAFVGGLHFLEAASASSIEIIKLQKQYEEYVNFQNYQSIKMAMNVSIIELALCLQEITSAITLENFINEYRDTLPMSHVPPIIRAKLYLVDATIDKLKGKYAGFIQKLQQAQICCWDEDVLNALVIVAKDPLFHKSLTQALLFELISLPIGNQNETMRLLTSITSPPKVFEYNNLLKPSLLPTLVHQYENGIIKQMSEDPFQSAMAYIDLSMAVCNPVCIASNWILACIYLYESLSRMTSNAQEQARVYAYRNMINELAINAFLLARQHLAPNMQIYIYKQVLSLFINTSRLFTQLIKSKDTTQREGNVDYIISPRQTTIISQLLKYTIRFAKLAPLMQLRPFLSYDIMFLDEIGREFLQLYWKAMSDETHNGQSFVYQYFILEGVWKNWIRSISFQSARQQSIQSLLESKHWKVSNVELLLNNPLIPRTPDGWLSNKKKPLFISGSKHYSKVDGIKININTGEITFLFVPARRMESIALFGSDDIADVLKKGITKAVFTLNQPDNEFLWHPFQRMRYAPANLINTQYLITLLHADYLLKFITMGIEVNAKAPFLMREASEGFMKRLPKRLQELLKPLYKRDRKLSYGNIHRFWIEAGDPIDEVTIDQKANDIIYRIGDVPMYVKQHLLKYDDEGNLIDDNRFNNCEDQSSEANFAKSFTDNYNEIGAYFPELLRLKELVKLGALVDFIRQFYKSLQKNIAEDIDVRNICDSLSKQRSEIEYPLDTSDNVQHFRMKILEEIDQSNIDLSYDEESDFRKMISSELANVDTEDMCEDAGLLP